MENAFLLYCLFHVLSDAVVAQEKLVWFGLYICPTKPKLIRGSVQKKGLAPITFGLERGAGDFQWGGGKEKAVVRGRNCLISKEWSH